MMTWAAMQPNLSADDIRELLGYIPDFLSDHNPQSAKEQIDANYQHGGGWHSFKGFTMLPNGELSYPGDPPTRPIAETKLRDETIRFYEHSWVAIIQKDGSFEIARID